jgi:hypothetical protein
MTKAVDKVGWLSAAALTVALLIVVPMRATAQDNDDPPIRVARLGYMEGSVSFQPAGEDDWVGAVPNRPMTTDDKLWADKDSRVAVQLGTAAIRLNENTGISFLNLDDHTVQIQLSSGAINVRVRQLGQDDDFEVDTPNLAFVVTQPGSYRVGVNEDGTYTLVAIRDGAGQATGNGQTYSLHGGQRCTFSGTESLNADVEDIGPPDTFDNWAYARDHRWDDSRSAQYVSRDVVGFEDLDDNGDWRDDPNYGHIWFPTHVDEGWAPYHVGHWDWIEPWGYTWVDDSPWGYAPFHYGRWAFVSGRWGWIAGPANVQPVYAPALVVFIGGGPGGFGGNVGWFPLGPREVYVPPYQVSRGYMTQVNVSNTTVNPTVVTNIYNTTVVNKSATITNVTYVNRNVHGAVTVVPQGAFAGAQPVAKAAVAVNPRELASAPISSRVAIVPTHQAVLGAKASTAGHVNAPPAAVMNRPVIAKKAPPPPPVSFAKQQRILAAHPGQSVPKAELQQLRPAAARPLVKMAPPGKPATPRMGHPNPAMAARPGQPGAPAKAAQPGAPANQPVPPAQNRPPAAQPNHPEANRPEPNRPTPPNEPASPPQPESNQPAEPAKRPPGAAETNRPESNRPETARPQTNRPEPNRPETARPEVNRPEPKPAPKPTVPAEQPEKRTPPPAAKPASPPGEQPKAQTPEQRKQEEEHKKEEKPPGPPGG